MLELGFGIGTNFRALQNFFPASAKKISFTSIEKDFSGANFYCDTFNHPPTLELLENLSFQEKSFEANLIKGEFELILRNIPAASFDCIFFDPFSPKTNPEAWSTEIFQESYRILRASGRLVTYSVSRSAKDGLSNAGFQITKRELPKILKKRSSLLAEKVEKSSK